MRINDDDPDVARHLKQIEIRALERLARELRRAQREGRGDDGAMITATRARRH
ncbi:MAG: hypothetical protein IPK60_20800 [Sandaracinaceae bacterium]|nr:hypothetical protein [Sandaracinaceae bacterium]